jgi:hypothetical protein
MRAWSLRLLFAWVLIAAVAHASAGGYVLVRNARNPVAKLSREAVKGMFSGRITTWDTGNQVVLVIGSEDAPAMIWLAPTLFGVSTKTLLIKIKQQVFRGEMPHPLSANDDGSTLTRVASSADVAGFVSEQAAKSLPAGIAIIAIIE